MHWDFTIRIGDVIALLGFCGTVSGGVWVVVRKIDNFLFYFREYPPHRHLGRQIVYPKGLSPDEAQEINDMAAKGRSHA